MPLRYACVLVGLLGPGGEPPPAAEPAVVLWQQGQDAMRDGQVEKAITLYRESLRIDPTLARNHLSLAAGFVALGHEERAGIHLARYLEAQPDHFVVRTHYAELLLRLDRPREAQAQYERFVEDVQGKDELAEQHLVNCHSRLMEIAQARSDAYGERLHRGIGLYLLAVQRARLPEAASELSVEGLLFRAAGELSLARQARPNEAQPCWYLHEVWTRLGQQQPANRWLRAAEGAAPFAYLTPAEQKGLQLACRQAARESARK